MDKFKVLHENVISDEGVKEKKGCIRSSSLIPSCILISMILVVLGVMMFFFA